VVPASDARAQSTARALPMRESCGPTERAAVTAAARRSSRSHEAELRARRLRMGELRYAAGQAGQSAGLDGSAHALSPPDAIPPPPTPPLEPPPPPPQLPP